MINLIPPLKIENTEIVIPGSKSVTNRALILAALTTRPVTLKYPLICDDTQALISSLVSLGINIERQQNEMIVLGSYLDVKDGEYDINANLSGTTIRFMTAFCCIVPGIKQLYGQGHLNKRPIKGLVDALMFLGAKIGYMDEEGYLPLKITSSSLQVRNLKIDGSVSSQFLSAIMLITPVIGNIKISVTGNTVSQSYINLTKRILDEWNFKKIESYAIEGDYSAASYFAAIAVLTKSKITLSNLKEDSTQGDREFFSIISQMGNKVSFGENKVTVVGKKLAPIDINMENCPDQAQTLAVLAAFADGKTVLTGVRSLRLKETERVIALQNELLKMGIKTESPDVDTLIIHGGDPKAATIETYGDHRMAMSFAVAGSKIDGMKIKNPEVVSKTFPNFWDKLNEIGIKISL